MSRAARWIALILALTPKLPLAASAGSLDGRVVIVQSSDITGKIKRQQLIRIVQQTCSEFQVDEATVPQIIFIHVREDEARAGGVPAGTTVMVERSSLTVEQKPTAVPPRYLVWVVGKSSDAKIVGAVAHILRLHLRPDLSDADLIGTEKRIVQRLRATVDVNSFVN